jgi:adiponectin receptor
MSALRQRMQRLLLTPTPDNGTQVSSTAASSPRRVVARHEAPLWLQDNEYIHTGFRLPSYSYLGSFASLTYLHNETVNIYSHLIGAILLPGIGVLLQRYIIKSHRYKTAGRGDLIVFGIFFVGAIACLTMSATYHALSNHSPRVHDVWLRLDVSGIAVLTAATFVPGVYYGFYCEPLLQKIYWTMVCHGWHNNCHNT